LELSLSILPVRQVRDPKLDGGPRPLCPDCAVPQFIVNPVASSGIFVSLGTEFHESFSKFYFSRWNSCEFDFFLYFEDLEKSFAPVAGTFWPALLCQMPLSSSCVVCPPPLYGQAVITSSLTSP